MSHSAMSARRPSASVPRSAQSERARRVPRRAGERLLRREAEQRARHVEHQQQRGHRRGARIAVGGDRHRHAVRAQRRDGRHARLAQRVERAGQQHRDGAGARHRRDAGVVVYSRWSAESAPNSAASAAPPRIGELVGVELHRQPVRARRGEHASRLRGAEADRLAERVDRVRKPGAAAAGIVSRQTRSM